MIIYISTFIIHFYTFVQGCWWKLYWPTSHKKSKIMTCNMGERPRESMWGYSDASQAKWFRCLGIYGQEMTKQLKQLVLNLSQGFDGKSWGPLFCCISSHKTQLLVVASRPLWSQWGRQLACTFIRRILRLQYAEKGHCVLSALVSVPSAHLCPALCSVSTAVFQQPQLHLNTLKSKELIAAAGQTQTVHHLEVNPSQPAAGGQRDIW